MEGMSENRQRNHMNSLTMPTAMTVKAKSRDLPAAPPTSVEDGKTVVKFLKRAGGLNKNKPNVTVKNVVLPEHITSGAQRTEHQKQEEEETQEIKKFVMGYDEAHQEDELEKLKNHLHFGFRHKKKDNVQSANSGFTRHRVAGGYNLG